MTKNLLFFLIFLHSLALFAQKNGKNKPINPSPSPNKNTQQTPSKKESPKKEKEKYFEIKGYLEGSNNDELYLMVAHAGGTQERIDTAKTQNGIFNFKGKIRETHPYTIVIKNKPQAIGFLMAKETPLISISGKLTATGTDDLRIVNSPLETEYQRFNVQIAPYLGKQYNLYTRFEIASKKGDTLNARAYYERWIDVHEKLKTQYRTYFSANPNSFVCLPALELIYFDWSAREIYQLYQSLSDTVRNSEYGKEWRLLVEQTLFANSGDFAPNFSLMDIKGDSVKLENYRGKYVILDFWASWCRPCRADLPYLGKAYDKYKNQQEGLEIISISIDNNYALWTETVFKEYMPWVNVIDNTDKTYSIARLYNVGFIPASFLIDPNGKIMDTNIRGAKWDNRLQEIFVK